MYYWQTDQKMSTPSHNDRSAQARWTARSSAGYPAPAALAVDIAVLTVRDGKLMALAVPRDDGQLPEPRDDGQLALPVGFVGESEAPAQTAARKLHEKTGLQELYLEQLATFAAPDRDPRGWIPTVAHLALVPAGTESAGAGAADAGARWIDATDHPPLAFDHDLILASAIDRVRGKLWWSNIVVGILPDRFTLAQARKVYEAIADTAYDPATFARDLRATGLITPTGESHRDTGGRPAALYEFVERRPAWGAGHRKRVPTPGD